MKQSSNLWRIWRSPDSQFGIHNEFPDDLQEETIIAEKNYTDEKLSAIAGQGFNAIWIHGQLHHIVPHNDFPEFALNGEKHIDAVKKLIDRAKTHGIKVFMYLQPPRAIPVSDTAFWKHHIECGGMIMKTYADDTNLEFKERALCTSKPQVRKYLREAFAAFAKKLPELAGYIIITASEYPAHCYSRCNCKPGSNHQRKLIMDMVPTQCPVCGKLEPWDVVNNLIRDIRDGVRSTGSCQELIFWNWSWTMYCDPPCREIIDELPEDCILMADFERGGTRSDGVHIDEYSIGYAGPSENFNAMFESVRKRGIRVMAKLQIGTTHELATVRSIPALGKLREKALYIRNNTMAGFMGCWNFGNLTSGNTTGFNYFLETGGTLRDFAEKFFPNCNPDDLVAAWNSFGKAMEYYPFCVPLLYNSPVNHAIGLLPGPGAIVNGVVGRSWLPDARGEDYSLSITSLFPLDDLIGRFEKMAKIWDDALKLMTATANGNDFERREYGNAAICGAVWKCSAILYKIYRLKLAWNINKLPEYQALANEHRRITVAIRPYLESDLMQGFHIEGRFKSF